MSAGEPATLHLGGHEVTISNPDKVLFPKPKYTKLDLVNYYVAVADGALRGAGGRPNMLVRFPNGINAPSFYQKRAPESRPPWIEVVTLRFPSGRTADEVVPRTPAALAWLANLACLELHPHPVRAEDLDHPDELRVDLDPVPGIKWPQVRQVAQIARAVLEELGLVGWPKTSGSRGMHLFVRIERHWGFACFSITTRTRRTEPSLQPTPSGPSRMRGSQRRSAGMRSMSPIPLISRSARCRGGLRRSVIDMRRWTITPDRWSSCSSCRSARRRREWATRPGRRTTASSPVSPRGCNRRRLAGCGSRSFR